MKTVRQRARGKRPGDDVVPSLPTHFDETVYVNGGVFKTSAQTPVSVSNNADRFILESVFDIPTATGCSTTAASSADGAPSYSLNPTNPCADINVYTLECRHSGNRYGMYPHRTIRVLRDLSSLPSGKTSVVPLKCAPFRHDCVYTYNDDLTPFEMAVMLKFYSIQLANVINTADGQSSSAVTNDLFITYALYHKCVSFFDYDPRTWFYADRKNRVMLARNGELIVNGKPVWELGAYARSAITVFEPKI